VSTGNLVFELFARLARRRVSAEKQRDRRDVRRLIANDDWRSTNDD